MTIVRRLSVVGVPIALCLAGPSLVAQVTSDRLAGASSEPQHWLTYSGTYDGKRFSPLDQITRANVGRLALQWVFQTRVQGSHETTPLVIDDVMYLTTPQNHAYAIDVRTGRPLWHYERALPKEMSLCCGPQNRGFGALGDLLFLGTLDAHVVALDAKTGRVRWDVEAAEANQGYSFTGAPLVVKDKVIVGAAGGEYGIRGFIDAYDATTGKRAWRFYTIPGEGEPGNDSWAGDSWKRGGAPAWVTGAYDPALNTLYWGTGNPGPQMYGANRRGDNLYSDSLVALDPDTGTLKWHFQFTPHDVHDWDATHTPILIDETIAGTPRKLVAVANRNGFFYTLDRVTGQFLRARSYTKVTWATHIDERGRPVLVPNMDPSAEGTRVCPSGTGGTNWHSPSYSPMTRLMYFFSNERCDTFMADDDLEPPHRAGRPYIGSAFFPDPGEPEEGAVRAVDPTTGATRWEFRQFSGAWAGVTATAGGLVFSGDGQGNFIALDAESGRDLWHVPLGAPIRTAAISYAVDRPAAVRHDHGRRRRLHLRAAADDRTGAGARARSLTSGVAKAFPAVAGLYCGPSHRPRGSGGADDGCSQRTLVLPLPSLSACSRACAPRRRRASACRSRRWRRGHSSSTPPSSSESASGSSSAACRTRGAWSSCPTGRCWSPSGRGGCGSFATDTSIRTRSPGCLDREPTATAASWTWRSIRALPTTGSST